MATTSTPSRSIVQQAMAGAEGDAPARAAMAYAVAFPLEIAMLDSRLPCIGLCG